MDWFKVKNILIFILVTLNIVLFTVFYRTNTQDKIIKNQTSENVVSLLSANNVKIDKKAIPEPPAHFTGRYIERVLDTNSSFIGKLLGSSYNQTESVFTFEDKTLSFSGNMLDFSDKSPDNPPGEFTEDNIKKYCIEEMKKLDINYKIYSYDGLNFGGDKVKAIFSPSIGKHKFFDSFLSFEISQKGITAIQGKNVLLSKAVPSISTKVFDINSVLLNFGTSTVPTGNQVTEIISINLGYYIGGSEERYSNVLAIPAWQIATNNGSIFYYDARNGKSIE